MKYVILIWMLLFTGCQPSFAVKDVQVTDKSCQMAVTIAKDILAMYRNGANQYDVMSMVNSYKVENNDEAYAGKVYAQLSVLDIQKSVRKRFSNAAILEVYVENCKINRGFHFAKGNSK